MLNLGREENAMLQGQSPGRKVVARAVQIDEVEAQVETPNQERPDGSSADGASGAESLAIAQEVARRVWELMRQDVRIDLERRKGIR